ncbi:hypothetical protein BH10BAC1_BH10BAC1_20030 [soil metagenome]
MESEQEKRNQQFATHVKIYKQRAEENKEFFDTLGKSLKGMVEASKEIAQIEKQNLINYFNAIHEKVIGLNNNAIEICRFLHSEKIKCSAKYTDASIRKDGYDKRLYRTFVDEIIVPTLKQWESILEFEKTHPPQIISNKPVLSEQKIVQNQPQVEIIHNIPEVEKITPDIAKIGPKLPEGFKQINCKATEKEILHFFMILSEVKNKEMDKFYMKEEDVLEFAQKNFSIFNTIPTGKYFPINLGIKQKGRLIDFMNEFYRKYDYDLDNNKMKYALLLINNFERFKDDDPQILLSNMSPSKGPIEKNKIPVTFLEE